MSKTSLNKLAKVSVCLGNDQHGMKSRSKLATVVPLFMYKMILSTYNLHVKPLLGLSKLNNLRHLH